MRAILFRGKRVDNGEWVYGDLAHSVRSANGRKPHKSWIVDGYFSNGGWLTPLKRYAVIDKSIGEYTSLKDRNGNEIFEGDILIYVVDGEYGVDEKYLVVFDDDEAAFRTKYYCKDKYMSYVDIVPCEHFEVIGNIYDNPELLNGKQRR